MDGHHTPSPAEAWARFRFAVIGPLLSAPPPRGDLAREIEALAAKKWKHPITGVEMRLGFSTIEKWLYTALRHPTDPLGSLRTGPRSDLGKSFLNPGLATALRRQYTANKEWSYLLHSENLASLVKEQPELGPMRSYSTILRYMKAHGMVKKKRKPKGPRRHVEVEWVDREIRSFESPYVGSLWHCDFHHCSRKVLVPSGGWYRPIAFGMHDDHSRIACHVQWYLCETTEVLVHGISQAIQKWNLPRELMTDQGGAMKAAEFRQGLARVGISYDPTAPYSPYQNAKEETFWNPLEGRLIAMLKNKRDLTLDFLNAVTQAWVDIDYNRKHHSELGSSPLERYLNGPDVLRPSPSSEELRLAFRMDERRTQRHSDGTASIEGTRFEVPSRFRHLRHLTVRYARWNLDLVHLVDPRTGTLLCRLYPLDKEANADARRRRLLEDSGSSAPADTPVASPDEIPPLLREIIRRYNQSGRPPGSIARDGRT